MNTEEKIKKLEAEIADLKSIQKFDFNTLTEKEQKRLIALHIIEKKIKELNKGKVPNWNDSNEEKWFPVFDMRNGFSFYFADVNWNITNSIVGSHLCLFNKEDAEYMGKENIELYRDLYT
jgi:hypothetical protein